MGDSYAPIIFNYQRQKDRTRLQLTARDPTGEPGFTESSLDSLQRKARLWSDQGRVSYRELLLSV